MSATPDHQPAGRDSLTSLFARFLKFGLLAWGGPAAQIAMISKECVDEERWVDQETFKKTLAVYQVLPGPEAHELCVFFGRLRGGRMGGFVAGFGLTLGIDLSFVLALIGSGLAYEVWTTAKPRWTESASFSVAPLTALLV